MIRILFGKDDFRVRHALRSIREALAAQDEMLESNTTVLDGATISADELLAHALAVPFLASHRLVVVEGLLERLGGERRGRRTKGEDSSDPLAAWRMAAAKLGDPASMPPTTTVVLVDGVLKRDSPGLAIFASLAEVREFPEMRRDELEAWVGERAGALGLRLQAGAAARIAERLGGELWAVENALAKLSAYAGGDAVDRALVDELVTSVMDEKVWTLTDSIVVGDDRKAQASLQRLLADGEPPTKLAFMVAKQYRTLVLVKDLRERAARSEEIARAAGVPGFKLNAISGLAARYTWDQLREAYRLLLESDLSVKRGVQDDESALQLLVHELCGLAPVRSGRPAYAR